MKITVKCEKCGEPLFEKYDYISIHGATLGSYPNKKGIQVYAYHGACDPLNRDNDFSYAIDYPRFDTLEKVMSWLEHLEEKVWGEDAIDCLYSLVKRYNPNFKLNYLESKQ